MRNEVEDAGSFGALGEIVVFVPSYAAHSEALGVNRALATIAVDERENLFIGFPKDGDMLEAFSKKDFVGDSDNTHFAFAIDGYNVIDA